MYGGMSAYGKEEAVASGVRCFIINRMTYGMSTLRIGTYFEGKEDNKPGKLADFSAATTEAMETTAYQTPTCGPPVDTRIPSFF